MSEHLAAIASTGGAAWLCWRLIRPVLKWIALLGVLIVLLAVNLRGSLLGPDSPESHYHPASGVTPPGMTP
jgi:hypothetical protein